MSCVALTASFAGLDRPGLGVLKLGLHVVVHRLGFRQAVAEGLGFLRSSLRAKFRLIRFPACCKNSRCSMVDRADTASHLTPRRGPGGTTADSKTPSA